jgi:methylthioribose-1-phosphate isomerase
MARRDRPGAEDATRREFFRAFGRQAVRQAGELVGAAAELRRNSGAVAQELLDLGDGAPEPSSGRLTAPASSPASTFRSPYLFTGDGLVVLDQRELPGRVTTFEVRDPSEVASAMRAGAINAGPVLAEVGAYAMVLACGGAIERNEASRHQRMRAAAGTLRAARREVRALAWAVDRLEARYDGLADGDVDTAEIRDALRAEADAIASEATVAHAQIGRVGAEVMEFVGGRPVNLLVHTDMGPLSCGAIGTGTALFQALTDAGRSVHAWVTEASPTGEGARISALQLTQLDIPHTVIPDTAVGWLFANRTVHAALLRGDQVCANGDTGAPIGSLSVARLAQAAGVPVFVLTPLASVDPAANDGAAIATDLHSGAEALAAERSTAERSTIESPRPAVFGVRLSPAADVVPASLITSIVTEAGALAPPFAQSLSRALAGAN